MINPKIYRQADSRWGALKYPSSPYTMARSGCGCVAVTHCLIEEPEYCTWTPKPVRKYMVSKGYATRGHGTTWAGIKATLEHYGYKVSNPSIGSSMKPAWEKLAKSMKRGVLLFRAGTRGGVTWTTGGHYVAFVDYKYKNGKHWFYTKDSSGRANDGWHSYEGTMRGLLPQIWICMDFKETTPKLAKTSGYTGLLPTVTIKHGSSGAGVKKWQKFLRWTFGKRYPTVGGHFKLVTLRYTLYFQRRMGLKVDGIVGTKTRAKAKAMKK